ncbi:uncharacterized protein LOC119741075 [Patiria miniata]|uniref:Uncharacterized protein n=1 Tax=Patiria miniata TaxID=46514 RepID=A0A914BB42_PATMI|nr:uncharacterized protein LOC119741075 [Patiria miniata]
MKETCSAESTANNGKAGTEPVTAEQTLDEITAKVLAERDIKEGILALQDRLRQLEMKLSDCTELYLRRRQRRAATQTEARTARVCNTILVCSAVMLTASYLMRWLRGVQDTCYTG